MKVDLKDECAKEYFVAYRGTSVLMQFVRPSHKQGLLSSAVDILGIMTLESLSLPGTEFQDNSRTISIRTSVIRKYRFLVFCFKSPSVGASVCPLQQAKSRRSWWF